MPITSFASAPGALFAAGLTASVYWTGVPSGDQERQSRLRGATRISGPFTRVRSDSAVLETAPRKTSWLPALSSRADHVARLSAGWDGPGSVPISSHALYLATTLTHNALRDRSNVVLPYFVPGGDGSLQLEWHKKHGELELDIQPDGEMSIWGKNHHTGAEFEGNGEEAIALFYRWAPWLASFQSNASHVQAPKAGSIIEIAA